MKKKYKFSNKKFKGLKNKPCKKHSQNKKSFVKSLNKKKSTKKLTKKQKAKPFPGVIGIPHRIRKYRNKPDNIPLARSSGTVPRSHMSDPLERAVKAAMNYDNHIISDYQLHKENIARIMTENLESEKAYRIFCDLYYNNNEKNNTRTNFNF